MAIGIYATSFDALDAAALAGFWARRSAVT